MWTTRYPRFGIERSIGAALALGAALFSNGCRTTEARRPVPDAPSLSPTSGVITLGNTAKRVALLADESPVGPALAKELDLVIRDVRQAASSGPPSPLLASKLGELLLLQPDATPAMLDEAERWFRASLTGATGSQDWVPGWIGLARVETRRAVNDGNVARITSARAALANAEKAITTLQSFVNGPGTMPTAPDAQGLSPSDAYSQLVGELASNEALPTRFIAAGSAMQDASRKATFHLVGRLRARRALGEGEATLAEWTCAGRQPTTNDVLSALQPALELDQNLVDVRVVMIDALLAVARDGARIDLGAAVAAHTQARTLLTLASASQHVVDASLLRALLRANNLLLSSYLNRELSATDIRDRQLIAESSGQVVEIARSRYRHDGELLALTSTHLAMIAIATDKRNILDEALNALALSSGTAAERTAADPISRADAEHLCRLAAERIGSAGEAMR